MSGERILVAGWVNSPHVIAWGDALLELGYEVHLAGEQVVHWPPIVDPGRFASVAALETGAVPGIKDRRLGHGLARVARALRPDLVHAHWVPGYGWMAARAGLRPLVTSAWGSDLLCGGRRLDLRSRRALRASDLVLADSAPLGEAARRIADTDLSLEIFNWGVDLERYRPDAGSRAAARQALGLDERPTVLTTRALDPVYNPAVLLEAVALVRRRRPDLRLLLKHPRASLPAAIEASLRELALSDATTVIGYVDEQELADLYRAADVYVSIPSSDSSPRSVWEALACGTPTVVSDLAWARDALRDGDEALLVAPAAEPVAAAIERILMEPQTAARLGASGRALTAATMDRRDQLARLDDLYGRLLG
jgi:glycosyltransferase involved in cell wall biosynthesis